MRIARFTLAAALAVLAAGCTRTDGPTEPSAAARTLALPAPPEIAENPASATQDPAETPQVPPADSTGEWGGALGSGT